MKKRMLALLLVLVLAGSLLPVSALAHESAVSEKTSLDWKQFYGYNTNNTMTSSRDATEGKCQVYLGAGDNKTAWPSDTKETVKAVNTGGITIVPAAGFYVKQVVIACDDGGGYNCNTAKRDGIAKFGGTTTESAAFVIPAANLSLRAEVNGRPVWHTGAGTPLHLMIWLAESPNPVSVSYDAGEMADVISSPMITYTAAQESQPDGVKLESGYPQADENKVIYQYDRSSQVTALPIHKILDLNDNIKTVTKAGKTYRFTGWKAYTEVDEAGQVGWNEVTGGTAVGESLTLYANYKLVAQWEEVTTFKIYYQFASADGQGLPDAVRELLPTDDGDYSANAEVSPAALEETSVIVDGGVWQFDGWDQTKVTITNGDVTFVGTWTFVPGEEPPAVWDISKSKTATNLNTDWESQVSLSLPSAQEELVTDVVFVLDESSCSAPVKTQVADMLESLYQQIADTGAVIKIGAVQFRGEVTSLPLTALTDSTKDTVTEFMGQRPSVGGSNMSAGLLAGEKMLDADTAVDDNRKYLILVSDGITYIWDDEATAEQENYGVNFANADAQEQPMLASPDSWDVKYGGGYVPEDWAAALSATEGLLEKTIEEKASRYDRENPTEGKPFVTYGEREAYASSVDIALYQADRAYQRISQKYHAYAVCAGVEQEVGTYPFGPSFMNHLAQGKTVAFSDIQREIYYLISAGSTVVDYMGYVEDGYDFDFVNAAAALTMQVGEESLMAEEIGENRYGFGRRAADSGTAETTYRYELEYQPGEKQEDEHFIWYINEPVSNFAPVSLTYRVKLTNPKTAAGTYGVYDGDGSKNDGSPDHGLYTNNSAALYPKDSAGASGEAELFAKPTVSYTVKSPNNPPSLNKKDHVAYIIGYPDGTVQPQGEITRAEVTTIFFRLLTDASRADYWMQTNPYGDVAEESWYNNAVSTMDNADIVHGYEDGTFRPNTPITRAEFAAIAARFSRETAGSSCSFTDVDESHWASEEIALAEELGYIQGYEDGSFRPNQPITRAEAMTLLNRVLERAVERTRICEGAAQWPDNPEDAWYYTAVQEATNSHTYSRLSTRPEGQRFCYEKWISCTPAPDWEGLEKTWSTANSK